MNLAMTSNLCETFTPEDVSLALGTIKISYPEDECVATCEVCETSDTSTRPCEIETLDKYLYYEINTCLKCISLMTKS